MCVGGVTVKMRCGGSMVGVVVGGGGGSGGGKKGGGGQAGVGVEEEEDDLRPPGVKLVRLELTILLYVHRSEVAY